MSDTLLKEASKAELITELIRRENVWSQRIIPCEHYRVCVRGGIREQGIGEAVILVVRGLQ